MSNWTGGNPYELDDVDPKFLQAVVAKVNATIERQIMQSVFPTYCKIDVILDSRTTPCQIAESDIWTGHLRITALDADPDDSVRMMCDADIRRCAKDFHFILAEAVKEKPVIHPSVAWARNAVANWQWLMQCFFNVVEAHRERFGDMPRYDTRPLSNSVHPPHVRSGYSTVAAPPPQQVPEEYRTTEHTRRWDNVVAANRQFYIHELYTARWSKTTVPDWFVKETHAFEATLASADIPHVPTTYVRP
jgi:hypothetical protein